MRIALSKRGLSVVALATIPLFAGALASPALAAPAHTSASISATAANADAVTDLERPRTIITQDGEIDDMDSMVRYLYYANEFDLEGIVYSSSMFHWRGEDPDAPADIENPDGTTTPACGGTWQQASCNAPFRWTGTEWLDEYIDEYEGIYPNLIKHAEGYPTPDELRALYKIGNVDYSSAMSKDTEGSELIKSVLLDDDPRPVYVQTWGGLNTLARALKSIEEDLALQGPDALATMQQKIYSKLIIYNILNQDKTLDEYIRVEWPGVKVIDNQSQFWSFAYQWDRRVPAPYKYTLKSEYMVENFLTGHGELLAGYHTWGDEQDIPGELPGEDRWTVDTTVGQFPRSGRAQFDFISEGDSPAFLFMLNSNGLRSMEDPTYGGWGGRFDVDSDVRWLDSSDFNTFTGLMDRSFPQTRWVEDIQNDFAARADWGVASEYAGANHAPSSAVEGALDRQAKAGQEVTLSGSASDPDGDEVSLSWWQYEEAGSYAGSVDLVGADSAQASFTVPADAEVGDTIHLILEAIDGGEPVLKHYQRVIVTVVDEFTPNLHSSSPESVSTTGATTVTLTGTGLNDVSSVTVGGVAVSPIEVAADGTSVSFVAPPSEAVGAVESVINAPGGSVGSTLHYVAPTVTSIDPARGPSEGGTLIALTGSDLSLAEGVTVGAAPAGDITAAQDGMSLTFVAPAGEVGDADIAVEFPGMDVTLSGAYAYAELTFSASKAAVTAGASLEVKISGLAPGEQVRIWLHSEPVLLATMTSSASGVARGTIAIPADTSVGSHILRAEAAVSGSVSIPLSVTSGGNNTGLASTGSDVLAPLGMASILVLLGAGVLATMRRKAKSAL